MEQQKIHRIVRCLLVYRDIGVELPRILLLSEF